jgi:ABC-type dipeptide/oligopeptide/nickel transport systems, permease components
MPESKSSKKIFICGVASLCIIAAVLMISFIAEKFNLENRNFSRFAVPGIPHIFGTDSMGRDMFIRTVIGFRNTFLLALISQIIPFVAGTLLGSSLAYFGGIFDEVLYHIFNIVLAFPVILGAIFLSVLLGSGIAVVLIVISVFGTVYNAKMVRAEIAQVKNEEFILALKINKLSSTRIFIHHILPRAFLVLLPLLPLLVGHSMIGISSYSFIGLGMNISTPELGAILKDSLRFISQAPWLIIFPGIFQFSCVLIFSMYSAEFEGKLTLHREI